MLLRILARGQPTLLALFSYADEDVCEQHPGRPRQIRSQIYDLTSVLRNVTINLKKSSFFTLRTAATTTKCVMLELLISLNVYAHILTTDTCGYINMGP